VDLHSSFRFALDDHAHSYLLALATEHQRLHAKNIVNLVDLCQKTYEAGVSPSSQTDKILVFFEERGFAEYMVPGFEYCIGMLGDEWRFVRNDGSFPYWTNSYHVYKAGKMVISALQNACTEEYIEVHCKIATLITANVCEIISKKP